MTFGAVQTLEAVERAKQLAAADPERLHEILVSLAIHVALACSFAAATAVAERRYRRRLSWPWGMLASTPVFIVLALEIARHAESGEGGLRGLSWFFGMLVGIPAALVAAWLSSWWMVGVAKLACSTWCVSMALMYAPLIASHGLSHW